MAALHSQTCGLLIRDLLTFTSLFRLGNFSHELCFDVVRDLLTLETVRVNNYERDYNLDSCFDSGQTFGIIIVG